MNWIDGGLWAAVAVLATAAAWWTIPREEAFDWERFFKIALLTRIRGPIEARDGDLDEWQAEGRGRVWFHPAGRDLPTKLLSPSVEDIPVPALPGERALVEALSAQTGPIERLRVLFGAGADEVLYEDPEELGEGWSLAARLGPEAGWQALAEWSEGLQQALERRVGAVKWAVRGDPALAAALGARVGEGSVLVLDGPEPLLPRLEALLPKLEDRLVVVGVGARMPELVGVLQESPGLRDRVVMVLGLDPEVSDLEGFTHEAMDTEIARKTPYVSLRFLDPEPGEAAIAALARGIWPQPPVPDSGRASIEALDLGVLPGPAAAYPRPLLADALLVTVAARLG